MLLLIEISFRDPLTAKIPRSSALEAFLEAEWENTHTDTFTDEGTLAGSARGT